MGGKFCLNYVSLCVHSWALRRAAPVDDCARAVLVGGEKRYAGIMFYLRFHCVLIPDRKAASGLLKKNVVIMFSLRSAQ